MECGDSSPLFSEGFSLHNLGVDPDGNGVPVWVELDPPIHAMEGPACQVHFSRMDNPLPFTGHDKRAPPFRRDLLVTFAVPRWIIDSFVPGTTSVPLHVSEGPACQVRILERCVATSFPRLFGDLVKNPRKSARKNHSLFRSSCGESVFQPLCKSHHPRHMGITQRVPTTGLPLLTRETDLAANPFQVILRPRYGIRR